MTEPDAWRYKNHPADMKFQFTNETPIFDVAGKKQPLFAESTIREEAEKLSEAPYTRSHTDKSDMSTKEAAYFEKGFAAAISQIQEVFKQKNGDSQ